MVSAASGVVQAAGGDHPPEEPHGGSIPGTGGTPLTIGAGITPAQLKAALARQLVPFGNGAKVGALLKSGGYAAVFQALEAGTVTVSWYQVPSGAKLAKKIKPKPILVATGKLTFSSAGTGQLRIRLTAQGKSLLKRVNK